MLKRSFEVFNIDLEMLNLFGAFSYSESSTFSCSFTYEQSRMIPRSRKRNTLLFEQLNKIIRIPYTLSHDVLPHFLYECIFVDTRLYETNATLCLLERSEGAADSPNPGITAVEPVSKEQITERIVKNLFRYGFTITGVPKRDPTTKKRALCGECTPDNVEDIYYRPFIASASMARKGIYLFVNEAHYKDLMERLSLGFFSFDPEKKRILVSENLFANSLRISPSKMSAYLGLMLSDGVSIREAQDAWRGNEALKDTKPPELTLDESTVFVAHDLTLPSNMFYPKGSLVWSFCEVNAPMKEDSFYEFAEGEADRLMVLFRNLENSAHQSWASIGCTRADLDSWSNVARAYLTTAENNGLVWDASLPRIPREDAQFRKNLQHYAYLLAILLYRQQCQAQKNSNVSLWKDTDTLDVRIAACISALESDQAVQHTALALRSNRGTLTLCARQSIGKNGVLIGVQPATNASGAPQPDVQADNPAAGNPGSDFFDADVSDAEPDDAEADGSELNDAEPDGSGTPDAKSEKPSGKRAKKKTYLCIEFSDKTKMYEARLNPAEELNQKLNMFDGVGLCEPETFDKLEKLLLCSNELQEKRRYSALIIRLPWIKGLLIRADFMRFFEEECKRKNGERSSGDAGNSASLPETITDAFGRKRALKDIRIIINESMLKGISYLRKLKEFTNPDKSTASGKAGSFDPWAYYWQQIRDFDYELLITGRNSPAGSRAKINSQFLSTIPLTDKEIDALINANLKKLNGYLSNDASKLDFYIHKSGAQPDEAPDESGEGDPTDEGEKPTESPAADVLDTDGTFGAALRRTEGSELQTSLLKTRYATSSLHSHIRSRIVDLFQGRLEISADYRFLAPDLVCMLHYLYDRYLSPGSSRLGKDYFSTEYVPYSPINQLYGGSDAPDQSRAHGHGFFYAPGSNTPWGRNGSKDICALRNPHYALGEGVVLTPLSGEYAAEYDEWYGELESCIQLPATAAASMGGGDFDGDRCLCVAEKSIVKALKRAIKANRSSLCDILKNRERYVNDLNNQIKASDPSVGRRLNCIKVWLNTCLPADWPSPEGNAITLPEGYCPPLFFGLDNHGIDFGIEEEEIDKYLLNAFLMTTEQEIGRLSIEALNLSESAYWIDPPSNDKTRAGAPDSLADSKLMKLRHWLFHWRVVSLALENGAEIDMAKTGVRAKVTELRTPYVFPNAKTSAPDEQKKVADMLARLEEHHTSILRIIIKKIKDNPSISKLDEQEFADALTEMMGEKPTSELESLMALGKSRQQKPHHNTHLIPCLMYQAVTPQKDQDGTTPPPKLSLPLSESSGKALRDFLSIRNGSDKPEDGNLSDPPQTPADGPGKEEGGNSSNPPQVPEDNYPDELVRDEQGIYFFKEVLKYLNYASDMRISAPLDSAAVRTPAALRQKLIELLGEDNLLPFLAQYTHKHYNPKINRFVNDINDFLFLSLASDQFVEACAMEAGTQKANAAENTPAKQAAVQASNAPAANAPNAPVKQAEAAIQAYIDYKTRVAEQSINIDRMKIRYAYCLRNLQRRFSLVEAYNIMNRYNRGFSESPLARLGIPENKLKTLLSSLETREV